MIKKLFKKNKYIAISDRRKIQKPAVPLGMYVKCKKCGHLIYKDDFEKNDFVCNMCNYHFRISARKRIEMIADYGSFEEKFSYIKSDNPLGFKGYEDKIRAETEKSMENEGVVTGKCKINGAEACIAVMNSEFMMGSMGSAVGEKITLITEYATDKGYPLIIFSASGGARMQEGVFSLMQMAKTTMAISRHGEKGNLYLSVLTDPTTGGVTASFAMLGDVIISEPGTLIGFAGRRVIEQTIKEELPSDFQSAEFLLEHGFLDKIVERNKMKDFIGNIIKIHQGGSYE